jgi:hypothetical protein
VTTERENSAAPDKTTSTAAGAVVKELAERWKDKRGTRPGRRQLQAVEADVVESIEDGDALEWLVASVVPFMVDRGYLDFARAKTHPQCPPPAGAAVPGQRPSVPDWCGRCNDGQAPENVGERFRRLPTGGVGRCPDCHPGAVRQHADV